MAEILKRAIHDSGEAVAAIARNAKIPQPVLHRFVAGERDLTMKTAEKLVEYFDLELLPRKQLRE